MFIGMFVFNTEYMIAWNEINHHVKKRLSLGHRAMYMCVFTNSVFCYAFSKFFFL